MMHVIILISIFLIISVMINLFLAIKIVKTKKTTNIKPSQELSDFLSDTKTHGYGFVRVDPNNVFTRLRR